MVVIGRMLEDGKGYHSAGTPGSKLVKRPGLDEGLRVVEEK